MSPSTGSAIQGVFIFPLRVYVQHTDMGGIVYHSRYLDFAEKARTEFLRFLETPHHLLHQHAQGFIVVKECQISYFMPARLDDFLEVRTTVKKVGGASIALTQEVLREATLLVHIDIRLGWITAAGTVGRLPKMLFDCLTAFLARFPPTEEGF